MSCVRASSSVTKRHTRARVVRSSVALGTQLEWINTARCFSIPFTWIATDRVTWCDVVPETLCARYLLSSMILLSLFHAAQNILLSYTNSCPLSCRMLFRGNPPQGTRSERWCRFPRPRTRGCRVCTPREGCFAPSARPKGSAASRSRRIAPT